MLILNKAKSDNETRQGLILANLSRARYFYRQSKKRDEIDVVSEILRKFAVHSSQSTLQTVILTKFHRIHLNGCFKNAIAV